MKEIIEKNFPVDALGCMCGTSMDGLDLALIQTDGEKIYSFGKSSFKAFGLTSVEVSIKKISNKKTISVIEDILKFGLTLFLLLNPIIHYDVKDQGTLLFLLLA